MQNVTFSTTLCEFLGWGSRRGMRIVSERREGREEASQSSVPVSQMVDSALLVELFSAAQWLRSWLYSG